MSKNIDSNLWKKLPNSIYLAALYKGVISLVFIKKENINNKVATLNIKYKAVMPTEISAIYFIFSGSLRSGGKK